MLQQIMISINTILELMSVRVKLIEQPSKEIYETRDMHF